MYKLAVTLLMMICLMLINACSPEISPQEAKILVTLGEIQRGMEANIEYDQFVQLLKTAKAEINLLQQSNPPSPCFRSAAEKSYAAYEIARKAWKKKMQEMDENRKADMEMTLSFSLSFSSINIERANHCYE